MPDIEEGQQVVTVGRTEPIQAGQATMAQSLPVVIASDQTPVPILDNLSAPSEVHDDLLGNPRVQSSLQLWDSTNILAIDPKAWKLTADPEGEPDYSSVTHLPQESGAQLLINTNAPNSTEARMQSRLVFPYQTGRITDASFGVSMLRDANATIEFGIFNNNNGYIIRVVGDDLFFVRRTNSGENPQNHGAPIGSTDFTVSDPSSLYNNHRYRLLPSDPSVMEEIVPRSAFKGDKLDGQGSSVHTLSLSNVTMFRIQMGWYGGSACRLMAYVPVDENLPAGATAKNARWVTIHQINTCDRLPFPSLGNPNLPMTFQITKTGSLPQAVFLKVYGTKAEIDGGDATKYDIFSQEGAIRTTSPGASTPLLSLRCKEQITNADGNSKQNILRAVPLMTSLSSQYRTKFTLLKNPTSIVISGASLDPATVSGVFNSSAQLSAIEYNTTATGVTGGDIVATFFTGNDDGQNIILDEIFRYNREFLTRPISNPVGDSGDILVLTAESISDSGNIVTGSITWGER
ncbi:virion structural protein [Synechococcus phage S-CBS4]|uniref:virion structural protein n=1 Tax=Synechococcus phage S-CBS4 TaxID=756275 RepID=UPI000246A704|nr:virion structural protein [Synechococcus phage S-CBS4]AEX56011.1 hypothetical protein S-CBS4_gp044 [Synechococcus phage S-CBS4]AGN30510.1 hypothetical protein SXAG_00063 [Synechococcus phage S-CBS4]